MLVKNATSQTKCGVTKEARELPSRRAERRRSAFAIFFGCVQCLVRECWRPSYDQVRDEPIVRATRVYSLDTHWGLGTAQVTAMADINSANSVISCKKYAMCAPLCVLLYTVISRCERETDSKRVLCTKKIPVQFF